MPCFVKLMTLKTEILSTEKLDFLKKKNIHKSFDSVLTVKVQSSLNTTAKQLVLLSLLVKNNLIC